MTGTAVDTAGNSATDTADVSIDQVEPTIAGAPDRAANGNGWYDADVTVSFACADALSGVASCCAPDHPRRRCRPNGDGQRQRQR